MRYTLLAITALLLISCETSAFTPPQVEPRYETDVADRSTSIEARVVVYTTLFDSSIIVQSTTSSDVLSTTELLTCETTAQTIHTCNTVSGDLTPGIYIVRIVGVQVADVSVRVSE